MSEDFLKIDQHDMLALALTRVFMRVLFAGFQAIGVLISLIFAHFSSSNLKEQRPAHFQHFDCVVFSLGVCGVYFQGLTQRGL